MVYAAVVVWLVVVVLLAHGVYQLWSRLVKPKVINGVLLPGTLVAQLGYVLGCLVTGSTVNNTALMSESEDGQATTDSNPRPKVPFVGPVVIALLPLVACGGAIYLLSIFGAGPIFDRVAGEQLPTHLPVTLAGLFELGRDLLSLAENILAVILKADFTDWQVWLFCYLSVCLTVRMAPFPGNLKGSLGAIATLGILAAIIGLVTQRGIDIFGRGWVVLSYAVGVLLLLLLLSLIVSGIQALVRVFSQGSPGGKRGR